jgi:hypothetical protein
MNKHINKHFFITRVRVVVLIQLMILSCSYPVTVETTSHEHNYLILNAQYAYCAHWYQQHAWVQRIVDFPCNYFFNWNLEVLLVLFLSFQQARLQESVEAENWWCGKGKHHRKNVDLDL